MAALTGAALERAGDIAKIGHLRLVLIEVPPFSVVEGVDICSSQRTYGRLDDALDWFIPTPQMIRIQDGTVADVKDSPTR